MKERYEEICPDHHMSLEEIEEEARRQEAEMAAGPSRRDFLRTASIAALGAGALVAGSGKLSDILSSASVGAKHARLSRVVLVKHPKAVVNKTPSPDIVDRMVNHAVATLADKKDPGEAWKELFSAKDVVGIKINGIAGKGLSSNVDVVNAIVAALTKAGVEGNNIIIWGSTEGRIEKAGFKPNTSSTGVRIFNAPEAGYSEPYELKEFGIKTRLTKIITEQITALINVPVLKDHALAGITYSLKNISHGSTNNPGDLHRNNCDPAIAEVNAIPLIREKQRLIIGDALLACYDKGPWHNPRYKWVENTIMAAHDPVAIDTVGLQIIEAKRKVEGIAPIGKRAKHLSTAARLGIGVDDPDRIEMIKEQLT